VGWPASLLVLIFAWACTGTAKRASDDEIDERIRFYSSRLETSPRLYPVHVQLAAAYLDKTRATHDPRWLAEARLSLERSVAIVPTFEAYVMRARVENYAHRFEDALSWSRLALPRTGSPDPLVVAVLVEAHAALGEYDQARALLPPEGSAPADLVTAAALAGWFSSQARHEEAARAYDAAAELARAEGAAKAAQWAEVMAAGALLDARRPELARPRLDAARRVDPGDPLLRRHEAEWLAVEGRRAEALAVVEKLLDEQPDPELHARAYQLALALGDDERAQRHFGAAERGFRRAIDAGEVYTLGALAQLYLDAGVRLDDARGLAERNLHYRRDRAAHALMSEMKRRSP